MGRLPIKHNRAQSNKRVSGRNTIQMGGGLTLTRHPRPRDLAARDKVAHRCHGLSHRPPSCQLWDGEVVRGPVGKVCWEGARQLLAIRGQTVWKKGGGRGWRRVLPARALTQL